MPESIIRIPCNKCNELKPTDQFYGYSHECKDCTRIRLHKWRASEVGKESRKREHKKYGQTEHGRAAMRRKSNKYKKARPEETKARMMVNNRIYKGTLERPTTCSKCGSTQGMIEAHHHSYAREHWLDVIWVCKPCHRVLDQESKVVK